MAAATTARPARPAGVVWACVLTWACCAFVAVGLGVTVLVLLVAPDVLFEELHRQNPELADQGLSDGEIEVASYVTAGPVRALGAGRCRVRRPGVPEGGLGTSGAAHLCRGAGAFSLVGMFASTIMVLPFVAAVVTVALLSRPDVRAWYAAPPPGPK